MDSGEGYPWYGFTVGDNSSIYSDFGHLAGKLESSWIRRTVKVQVHVESERFVSIPPSVTRLMGLFCFFKMAEERHGNQNWGSTHW